MVLIFSLFFLREGWVWATCEVQDYSAPELYQQAIEECQKEIDARAGAHEKNKEDLAALERSLRNTEGLIKSAGFQMEGLEEEIGEREADLGEKKEIFAARVRSFYIRSFSESPLLVLFSSRNASELMRELAFRKRETDKDKEIILAISGELADLEADKEKLAENKIWLEGVKASVGRQAANLREEIEKVEGYFSEVSGKIAQLSAKQEALLAARAGTFTTSVGEVPVSKIPCSGPPGSPVYCDPGGGDWFGGFSFGGWTHRKGMSQYGAKGRAESGQGYQDILAAYYGRTAVGKETGGTILVDGYGAIDFENYYLLGIAEMPSDWHSEALKAQAVAARSYAYRYKIEGRSICTTQACQVFSSSKASSPPAAWRSAVEATRGQVIEGVTTFYSSTAGGYLTYPRGFWDTTDGGGGGGFATRAWESKAGSPWFYSAWYTQSYTSGSAKCGRSHPWLTSEEMADILNAWKVLDKQGSDDRILPITINSCPIGGITGNPYSMADLKAKAESLDKGFSSVSSVAVVYSNGGETNSVIFQTDRGEVPLSGADFKRAFNLRAPGYIALRSPLFNIEKK